MRSKITDASVLACVTNPEAMATRIAELEQSLRKLEYVAYAAMNRGYIKDAELSEAACKALGLAHKLLGVTHPRDEPRCKFDMA